MKQRPRIYYTESQKALMWERWQKGESLQQIAQLFDRNHSSIQRILAETGGIRPAPRCRSRLALTLAEREEISRAVVAGHSIRSIAAQLGRAPSTISREIKRNGGQEGYRASQADQSAWDRARRPKTGKLAQNRALAHIVASKLQRQWSPEQIAGWLKRTYPDDTSHQVSHETIYRSLFIQARGALKKELVEHLRRTRVMRRSRHHTQKTDHHGRITDAVSISERPASVEDRARTRSLGRRPAVRQQEQPDCDPRRASITLCDAGEGRRQRYRDGHQRPDQERAQVTAGTLPIADLGSRQRDGRPQALHVGHRHQGLLLRSSESLAARIE